MNVIKKYHPLPRVLRTGMAALTLLILGACVTAPAQVAILPPAGQPAELSIPQSSPPRLSQPVEFLPPPLPPAEPPATPPASVAPAPVEPITEAGAAQPDYYQSYASYYAKRFNGRRTYTGERYDPDLLTAATRDFPLHSWLKVINPANGREVNVRINDLTGKRKTPLVDLSRAAAKVLGFLGKGKIRVHVIPLLPTP